MACSVRVTCDKSVGSSRPGTPTFTSRMSAPGALLSGGLGHEVVYIARLQSGLQLLFPRRVDALADNGDARLALGQRRHLLRRGHREGRTITQVGDAGHREALRLALLPPAIREEAEPAETAATEEATGAWAGTETDATAGSGRASMSARRAAIWSGVVPQQPPTTVAPASRIASMAWANSLGPTSKTVSPS